MKIKGRPSNGHPNWSDLDNPTWTLQQLRLFARQRWYSYETLHRQEPVFLWLVRWNPPLTPWGTLPVFAQRRSWIGTGGKKKKSQMPNPISLGHSGKVVSGPSGVFYLSTAVEAVLGTCNAWCQRDSYRYL